MNDATLKQAQKVFKKHRKNVTKGFPWYKTKRFFYAVFSRKIRCVDCFSTDIHPRLSHCWECCYKSQIKTWKEFGGPKTEEEIEVLKAGYKTFMTKQADGAE